MRTIRVTGKGQIKVKPDMTRITASISGVYPDYAETLRRSAEDTEVIRDLLAGLGFDRAELKTLSFSVDTQYESCRDKNGSYQQRLVGYRFDHTARLEFPSDNERLGRILYALANCGVKAEFRIGYTVSDPEAAKNTLLGKAVADAKEKAEVLTRAGGVALGDIQSIDYSWGEIDFEVRPMNGALLSKACMADTEDGAYALDIEPDDIAVSDTATVVWELV